MILEILGLPVPPDMEGKPSYLRSLYHDYAADVIFLGK